MTSQTIKTFNIEVLQHATYEVAFNWTTKVTVENPVKQPIVITGWSALLQVRDHFNGAVLFEASTFNQRIKLDGPKGRVMVRFSASDTTQMLFERGIYDLALKSPLNTVRRMLQGSFIVKPGVSVFV